MVLHVWSVVCLKVIAWFVSQVSSNKQGKGESWSSLTCLTDTKCTECMFTVLQTNWLKNLDEVASAAFFLDLPDLDAEAGLVSDNRQSWRSCQISSRCSKLLVVTKQKSCDETEINRQMDARPKHGPTQHCATTSRFLWSETTANQCLLPHIRRRLLRLQSF